MEGPLKKRRSDLHINYVIVFNNVLPYLFPGIYDDDWELAFWTYFALAGTCRKLRYWYFLRRWIGYLCPERYLRALLDHDFPVHMGLEHGREVQRHFLGLVRRREIVRPFADITAMSQYMINSVFEPHDLTGGFERVFADIPLYNLVKITGTREDEEMICFYAQTFAELVLAAYAICEAGKTVKKTTYLLFPAWKTAEKFPYIYFRDEEKKDFQARHLIGRLKHIGMTAPYDHAFAIGTAPCTAYMWFCEICNTSGTRTKKKPAKRLMEFVASWFPTEFYIHPKDSRKLPWNFQLQIRDGRNPERAPIARGDSESSDDSYSADSGRGLCRVFEK